jgi:hypothetical protein
MQPKYAFHAFQPPASASDDEHNFVVWLKAISKKLTRTGLGTVDMIPMMTEDEKLMLVFDVTPADAKLIRVALQ